jgi:8-oxo-dGTP pyrophosphatase MutT (NUDIX family)
MDQFAAPPFSAAGLRARFAAQDNMGGEFGDLHFNPGHPRLKNVQPLRDAAVLVAVVDHGDEATVILTKRAETLRSHTGQVAFPGGRVDPTDLSPEFAALREAKEEIGLDPGYVDIIGRLPNYITGSGYRIAPVLSVVRPGFSLALNADEVDAAFEVPLKFLMDPANHQRATMVRDNFEWVFFDMAYGGQRIWGATAGILRILYERLYA